LRFEKWQALGNDYLIVEEASLPWALTAARVRRLCEPHLGLGADGVLLLSASDDPRYVAALRIFNPDGSEAELSGNGAREAVMYLRANGWTDAAQFAISTAAGPIRPTVIDERRCRVAMGQASLSSADYPSGAPDGRGSLLTGDRGWEFQHVSIGNPQCAIAVPTAAELAALDLPAIGPAIESSELFPHRTNVSWFTTLSPSEIRARIFERGVGETLSSGTGACGAAIAHLLADGSPPPSLATVNVVLDGGELQVEIDSELNVTLTGWAVPVYRGELSAEFLEELDGTE
jgi:diaminopimelate epimerase